MSTSKLFIKEFNTSQILLGLDFGYKTIGLAISDKSLTIASPLLTIARKGTKNDILKIHEIINEYNVGGAVFGLPLSLDGNENEMTEKVRKFAREMEKVSKIKTTFFDERFSSDVVFKELRKNSISITKIKKKLNHLAASYILQGFLDTIKN